MFLKKKPFPEILFLWMISAAVYLPNIGKLTYYKDDWYYIYDGMIAGAKVFHEMFRIDRPARGYFFELYFSLFGANPLPYHLGTFFWRGLSAIGALWIFNILWPKQRKIAFLAALLFAIYPGYFWWISPIEYQPMIASLALQVFSIAFTLKGLQVLSFKLRIAYLTGAIVTGWLYIAMVDYAIGMEAFRFLCVYLLVNRNVQAGVWKRLLDTFKAWAWTALIPLGFVVWRTFFFTNERKATDIGGQLSVFFGNPIATSIDWFFQIYNSLLNLSVLAWLNQFPYFMQGMRLRDTAIGLVIAAIILGLVILAERTIKLSAEENAGDDAPVVHRQEALLLGSVGMAFGILPVIMANRYVNIIGFSHYGLPASLAAAVFLIGLLDTLSLPRARVFILYAIIVAASLAHYGISVNAVTEESALQKFWWQVSWRAPMIQPGTTLVIHYPLYGMGDGGFGLMEAANVIYFREPTGKIPAHYPLAGLTLNSETLPDILSGQLFKQTQYRSHTVDFDYKNLLVISQPTLSSCAHVINGNQPLISTNDPVDVKLAAPSSKIENVIVDATPVIPQEYIFGKEPEHNWCFYFQKADFASQLGKWDEIVALGEEANRLKFSPEDRSEWMPFLKAYAITANAEQLALTSKRVVGDKFLRQQACEMLTNIQEPLSPEVEKVIAVNYCKTASE
jgi:hypothetical protein